MILRKVSFFIFSHLILIISAAKRKNVIERLFDDLFEDADYDENIIPVENAPVDNKDNAINLGLGLSPINLDLDDAGILDVNAWIRMSWLDYRLKWNPEQYKGVKSIRVPVSKIWRPDISVYNQASFGDLDSRNQLARSEHIALVHYLGYVTWLPTLKFNVDCGKSDGPMLTMEEVSAPIPCEIKLGTWYDGYHLNITTFTKGNGKLDEMMDMSDFSFNSAVMVVSQEGESIREKSYAGFPEPYMSVAYKFEVKRVYSIRDHSKIYHLDPEEVRAEIRKQHEKSAFI